MTATAGASRPQHLRPRIPAHEDRRLNRLALIAAALAVVVPAALYVAVRGDGADDSGGTGGSSSAGAPAPAVQPLLGTPGDTPDRPALAIKIENTAGGRPQSGLAEADVVVEELVEGGLTRLMAIHHSRVADEVGPVRSARSTDIALLAELGRPLFAWSGANPTFAAAVQAADIVDVGYAAAPDAYWRDEDRHAPYDLYAAPEDLWAAGDEADPEAGPPTPLFTYRTAEGTGPVAGEPATGIATTGATGVTTDVRWDWDPGSGAWVRTQDGTPHVDDEGVQVSATNVVVRATPYRDSGVRDVNGAVVPEAVTVGEGEAWLLTEGRLLRGRWHKPALDAPTTYATADGDPLELTPGPTWVEVLPPGSFEPLGAG